MNKNSRLDRNGHQAGGSATRMATALQRSAFTPTGILHGIFGWEHVEAGVEAWVCDGKVIDTTSVGRISAGGWGTRGSAAGLLHPEPLRVEATGERADFSTSRSPPPSLTALLNPVYTAATSAPLTGTGRGNRAGRPYPTLIVSRDLLEWLQDQTGDFA